MSSADMRATETRATAWARTAEMCATTEVASAATDVTTTTEVTAAAAAANVTPATANMTTATATAATTAMTATTAASLRPRGSRTGQNDRQNNNQEIEFRHRTLDARGPR